MLVRVSQRPGGGRPPWATRPPAPRPDSPTDRNHQSFCFLRVRLDRFLQAHKSREENPPILICHPRATVLGESAREKSAERGFRAEAATARLRARREPESEARG